MTITYSIVNTKTSMVFTRYKSLTIATQTYARLLRAGYRDIALIRHMYFEDLDTEETFVVKQTKNYKMR